MARLSGDSGPRWAGDASSTFRAVDRSAVETLVALLLEPTGGLQTGRLAALAEGRDRESGGHIRRTVRYVRLLAAELARGPSYRRVLTDDFRRLIERSAPLHDIGKAAVRKEILLKPDRLTPEEFEQLKAHTTIARDALLQAEAALGASPLLRVAREVAVAHHERWDGTGYPAGLEGTQIPLPARIMAVADVYDALTSRRVYKPPFPHRIAIEMIKKEMGTHFDPAFDRVIDSCRNRLREIASELADSEEERSSLGEA